MSLKLSKKEEIRNKFKRNREKGEMRGHVTKSAKSKHATIKMSRNDFECRE